MSSERFLHQFYCLYSKSVGLLIFSFFPLLTASKIRYEITEGNYRGAFAVKNETGAIYVAGPLDYETRKEVIFFLLNK